MDEETNLCRIYKDRPWFCNGFKIWQKVYRKAGYSLAAAYELMEQQSLMLRETGEVILENLDWDKIEAVNERG